MTELPTLTTDADGLVPAIIQSEDTDEVLMLGYMDAEALRRTATEGRVTFWSRSRQEYWRKGDTSGHIQVPVSIAIDCDADTLLVRVRQTGAACHTGNPTCFFTPVRTAVGGTGAGETTAGETIAGEIDAGETTGEAS